MLLTNPMNTPGNAPTLPRRPEPGLSADNADSRIAFDIRAAYIYHTAPCIPAQELALFGMGRNIRLASIVEDVPFPP